MLFLFATNLFELTFDSIVFLKKDLKDLKTFAVEVFNEWTLTSNILISMHQFGSYCKQREKVRKSFQKLRSQGTGVPDFIESKFFEDIKGG